ncbi:MAG: glycoside hydrolase family 65 [Lachnospiraceae bacterium]|nr:glycoside hydrolase family 65 [Lachnospiraceae bacterium]
MTINRYELVSKHNPVLQAIDTASPLTIGNGEFAFTVDVTGLQSLYKTYYETLPLCTMSTWGWHTKPVSEEKYAYTLNDLVMTEFDYNGRTVKYPKRKMPGNEEVYDWLRVNPHRLNLARIGFYYKGEELPPERLSNIHQELKLYEGELVSDFSLCGTKCHVETVVDAKSDTIGIHVESELLKEGSLTIGLDFPYGSPGISGSDWEEKDLHRTDLLEQSDRSFIFKRTLDRDSYYGGIFSEQAIEVTVAQHKFRIESHKNTLDVAIMFSEKPFAFNEPEKQEKTVALIKKRTNAFFRSFWENGGIVKLSDSKDKRAYELERRIILSMYLMTVNSCGPTPPQETGLTCNSWYGKMHLEMYLWHCAWAPLWNHTELLERSLPWFLDHREEARENAARNQYKGCRWPKMISNAGIDCPSPVAPLLVWQQPHLIFMLELSYRQNHSREFLEKYWSLVEESAEFMVDFVVWNNQTNRYDLVAPIIPAQECHHPDITKNPTYEVEYWRYALQIVILWANRLHKNYNRKYEVVANHMAELPIIDGYYAAHENCPNTFTDYNRDHPSMLAAFGLLPNKTVHKKEMERTLDKVLECWKYESLWGWDFAVMAMTATRLHKPELAIDILLLDTPKNDYVRSGNNRQKLRKDLPLYLPGNGSLLLAIPLMVAGYDGCEEEMPGIPKDGTWKVEYENIETYV